VAQSLEILGERWTLLVIRELLGGSHRFSDIQRGVPLMSRSVLSQRLKSLVDAGVIERVDGEYRLTRAGEELRPVVVQLGEWGVRWARREIADADVDVALLVWDMQRRIDLARIPDDPVLLELEFRGAPRGKGRFFLHFKSDDVELCLTNPGHDVDLQLSTSPRTMAQVWMGELPFSTALSRGTIRLQGPSELVRQLPSWLQLNPFAGTPRP
jgi:DNA-binding HxlR family transcriptional regulator